MLSNSSIILRKRPQITIFPVEFMQITMLNLKIFLPAMGCEACFASKIFAVVKILINLAPVYIFEDLFKDFEKTLQKHLVYSSERANNIWKLKNVHVIYLQHNVTFQWPPYFACDILSGTSLLKPKLKITYFLWLTHASKDNIWDNLLN